MHRSNLKQRLLPLVLGLTFAAYTHGQSVFHNINNSGVTEFLDELANQKIIALNPVFKPYSRQLIAEKLQIADANRNQLTKRQQNELDFYLKDYNKERLRSQSFKKRRDAYHYHDSLFSFTINPILGVQYWTNENGTAFHRWGGLGMFAYIGDHVGIYASLRDNHENKRLNDTAYLTPRIGGNYKAQYDFSEMIGGISYDWAWGRISLVKDYIQVGTNYHGANILSGHSPTFAYIRLTLKPVKWLDFNYIHGWLVSEVIDSLRSYQYANANREVFHDKYLALNMFTVKPWKYLHFSFGNSVIYSDLGVHPAYLNPFMFYKSVDHTYNATRNSTGQNSQMFFDISIRNLKYLHFYGSWFLDVVTVSTIRDPERHSNHWSMKGGMRISNLVRNTIFTIEYTRNNPLAYQNDLITTQYESNHYNLGHYLRDNAGEIYTALSFKPFRAMQATLFYNRARKGPEYVYNRTRRDPANNVSLVLGRPYMEWVEWQKDQWGLKLNYQVINDGYLFFEYLNTDVWGNQERFTAPFFHGNTQTFSAGMNFGF